MLHLPAYIALLRFANERVVVVVAPSSDAGPREFVRAGARRVIVVGREQAVDASAKQREHDVLEVCSGVPHIPLPDASADLVVCLEAYGDLEASVRRTLLEEAARVLAPSGMWATLAEPHGGLDYWLVQDELRPVFGRVCMISQMPWEGFSLAPVLDDEPSVAPQIVLDERLLDAPPEAARYLALAWPGEPSAHDLERLTSECLLVPTSSGQTTSHPVLRDALVDLQREYLDARRRIEALELEASERLSHLEVAHGEIERLEALLEAQQKAARADDELVRSFRTLEEQLRARDADLAVLGRNVAHLETSLDRAQQRAEARTHELEAKRRGCRELEVQLEELARERDRLSRVLELAVNEREDARRAAVRLEAELEVLRLHASERDRQLARRAEEERAFLEATAERERLRSELAVRVDEVRVLEQKLTGLVRDEQGEPAEAERGTRAPEDDLESELAIRDFELQQLSDRIADIASQLEVHREAAAQERARATGLQDELEVSRRLLLEAQRRAADQERSLAEARAMLVRAGLEPREVSPPSEGEPVDDLFAELGVEQGRVMTDLSTPGEAVVANKAVAKTAANG